MYKLPQCFLPSLELTGLLFQGKKRKEDFQDGHLGFLIEMILAILIYKSPRCILSSFESIGLSVQEKKQKIDFQDGRHGGFLIRMILLI